MAEPTSSADSGRMVTGVFRDRDGAERAFVTLISRGYDKNEISVVMDDDTRQ